jgi:hypothetical protein
MTLKCPEVWRPCFYMYMSLALSVEIQEGMFYWYTDPSAGPSFSEVHFFFAIPSSCFWPLASFFISMKFACS